MQTDLLDKDARAASKPHYVGHRQRLRERFLAQGGDALAEYEVLELLLFAARPQGDMKPLAKDLLARFGSLAGVLNASIEELREVSGIKDTTVSVLKVVQYASQALLKEDIAERPILSSWQALLNYCTAKMGHDKTEQFRIFFLNNKNALIADEQQQKGTVDHTPVYPREVVKRALELHASAIILAHNHPSGDPSPSKADITMTKHIMQALAGVNIMLHDHVIIAGKRHYSFANHGLI